MSRMAANIHKKITIKPNDTIIFSSNPIPGNEKAVSKVINELSMKGAKVIFQDVHVSGHACQEEIKLIYSLVRPKYSVPVHGEYRHLTAQKHIAEDLGIPRKIFYPFFRKCTGDGSAERGGYRFCTHRGYPCGWAGSGRRWKYCPGTGSTWLRTAS